MDHATQAPAFPQSAGDIQRSFRTLPLPRSSSDSRHRPGISRVTKRSRIPKNNCFPLTSSRAMALGGWWNCNPANYLPTVLPSTPSPNWPLGIPLSHEKRYQEDYHPMAFEQPCWHKQQQAPVRPHESRPASTSWPYTQNHGNPLTSLADAAVAQVSDESLSGGGHSRGSLVDLTQAGRPRLRIAVACKQCRQHKNKCVPSETDECATCATKNRVCTGYSRVGTASLDKLTQQKQLRTSAARSQFNPEIPATQLLPSYSGHIPGYSYPHGYSHGSFQY